MTELDPHIAGLLAHIRALGQPDLADLPVPVIRMVMAENCRMMEGPPPTQPVTTQPLTLQGAAGPLDGRLYRPGDGGGQGPGILYFHGGGFVAGGLDSHDLVCRRLAVLSGLPVLAATYRLAPEHPFPAAHDDALSILAQVGREGPVWGLDPARIIVGGDSAGANLALATVLDAPADGPRPCGVLLFYPAVEFAHDFPSRTALGRDYLLTERTMSAFTDLTLPDGADRADPRISLLRRATMGHCPPVMLLTAGYDPLRDEGMALAERLTAEGVGLRHLSCPTLIHAFIHMTGVTGAVQPLLAQAADWCRQVSGSEGDPSGD